MATYAPRAAWTNQCEDNKVSKHLSWHFVLAHTISVHLHVDNDKDPVLIDCIPL